MGMEAELKKKEVVHSVPQVSVLENQVGKVRVGVGVSFESTCIWRSRIGQGNGHDASIQVSLGG